ncbi:hypothetical protein J2W98_003732 [Paenibacillus peoriae]|uniref:Uncharacterized protein n=1 Tax=Paenibacillus peoriae TaxID=59893 RepID=A0ABU1QIJ0_9BACL|nr:hypothetical protein [Paenibacillus peoriae]MDR6779452.1 hypothetical protein [Paenibacillus peoriae]
MRKTKLIVVVDVEIEDGNCSQDLADIYHQALNTVNETFVYDFVLYEHEEDKETFNELLDEIKTDFQYGDFREFGKIVK